MKAIGKYIILLPIPEEIRTGDGLLFSADDTDKLRYKLGKIVSVGTDVSVLKTDDTVYFDKHSSFTMMISQLQYTIIQERDVVVVV